MTIKNKINPLIKLINNKFTKTMTKICNKSNLFKSNIIIIPIKLFNNKLTEIMIKIRNKLKHKFK
jgi:hypothetical protein